jgi:hypothetical protein
MCAGKLCGQSDGCGGICEDGACGPDEFCDSGTCAPIVCSPACGYGEVCSGGNCVDVCDSGETYCSGDCCDNGTEECFAGSCRLLGPS